MFDVIDLTKETPNDVVLASRGIYGVILLVLHDTVGSTKVPDRNDLGLSVEGYAVREQATIKWFQGGGGLSVHYLVGPEACGAKIYRLAKESWVAYHAGGSARYPSSWRDPATGKVWQGILLGVGAINVISIGIERWGAADESAGPKQTKAMIDLAVDIALRNHLRPDQIVAHKQLEADRQDGGVLLAQIREAVAKAQMDDFDPNPDKLSIGPGMFETLKAHRLVAYTDEQYFSPNKDQAPGLAQRSFVWTTTGECLVAFQDVGKDNKPLATWSRQIFRPEPV